MKEFDIIKKYMPRVLCAAMSLTIMCSTVGVTAYSAGVEKNAPAATETANPSKKSESKDDAKKYTKEETVYVIADANGTPNKVIVSGWIKNNQKADKVVDKSNLTDLENVKGDETYTINEDKMVEWGANGSDIFYKGNSTEQLPVGVSVKYELDGKAVDPSQLAGKSGKLKITFTYTNRQFEEVKVGDKKEKIYVPFVMMTGMMLDSEKFTDVTVSNGKVINDGTHTFVAGFALPGMQETLDLDKDKLELPSTVEITADVEDFELATTLTVATNDMFSDVDTDKIDEKLGELTDKLGEFSDGVDQLADGTSQLYTGLGTLLDKSGELIDGVNQLYNGAEQLKDGAAQLDTGAGTLKSGAAQLDSGVGSLQSGAGTLDDGAGSLVGGAYQVDSGVAQLQGYIGTLANGLGTISSNSGQLNGGAAQVFNTLLSTADTQIAAAGLTAPALTIDNYGTVLDGLIGQLSDEAVQQLAYNTALKTVTAAVESQREVIRQAVEAEVKKQVTNGVLAAAGLGLDADSYEYAVAAGQIPEDVQAQIAAGITSQMAAMSGTIDANTESQIASLIESNMQGEEVQSQIAEAVAKAQAGRQSLSALKTQLDSYNTFYQGVLSYTAGVDQANAGAQQILGGTVSLKSGTSNLAYGASQLKGGTSDLKSGASQLKSGSSQLKSGTDTLKNGTGTLTAGADQLFAGIASLKEGSGALVEGVTQLQEGSMQLNEGMETLRDEGVKALTDAVNGDLTSLVDRFKAMVSVSKKYTSFSGNTSDEDGKVDFIFKTDGIKLDEEEE